MPYDRNNTDITPDEELEGLDLPEQQEDNPLDAPEVRTRLRRVQAWKQHAQALQIENRLLQMQDHDIYDGDQWSEEDKAALEERGQLPQVFNRVKPTVDWIIGTEKRTRVDYRVLPRGPEDANGAETKTKLLKYIADVNRQGFSRSRAFADTVKSGVGWIEVGIRTDPTEEPIFVGYEDWRNVWYDPLSVELDLSDARFLFREKWVDLDVACAMFPDRSIELREASRTGDTFYYESDSLSIEDVDSERDAWEQGIGYGDTFNGGRSRIRLTECWYRMPARVQILKGDALGTLDGATFDDTDQDHVDMVSAGHASTYDAIRMQVRCMIFCDDTVLQDSISPYRHQRFPLIPIWGYRKKRNNAPYGNVRNLKDPQDDLNKRRSKALFILSTNQVVADEDAVDDWDEVAEEVARPDGIVKKKKGSDFLIRNERDLAEEHIMLMDQDAKYIESTGGVTDEQMGRQTNATSGKAIQARQEQGHAVTSELYDNLRLAIQLCGEIELSLIEQYYTDAKVVRITGDRGNMEFVSINQMNEFGEVENDITARQADFQVDASNFSASIRQAAFESFMELMGQMDSQVALTLLDLVVDLSDLPGKEEMVRRIRQVNGQSDPDADQNDPEFQAEMEAKAQKQQQDSEYEELAKRLEVAERQSKIALNQASAAAKQAGIAFDGEKIRIEKAQTLHDIRKPIDKPEKYPDPNDKAQDNEPYVKSADSRKGRDERGLMTNNTK